MPPPHPLASNRFNRRYNAIVIRVWDRRASNKHALILSPAAQAADVLLTGTLGLAYPDTAKALNTAVDLARAHGTTVFVDVNWRPVFWPQGLAHAKAVILEYLQVQLVLPFSMV